MGDHRMDMKYLTVRQDPPLPIAAIGDHGLTMPGGKTGILERPVQETAKYQRLAHVRAEQMTLIARFTAGWVVAVDICRIVLKSHLTETVSVESYAAHWPEDGI